MDSPSITLITVTYNVAAVLPDLITSLRAQTDRSFSWIVVDGASTDGTVDIARAASDVITRFISEPDFGIYHAMNKAVSLCESEYYLVLGADDMLHPDAVANYRNKARQTHADLVAAAVEIYGAVKVPATEFNPSQCVHAIIPAHSVGCLIRTALHVRFGLYSKRYPIAADAEFLLKTYLGGAKLVSMDNVAGRFGSYGVSSTDTIGAITETYRIQLESGRPFVPETIDMLRKLWRHRRKIAARMKEMKHG